MKQKLVLRGPVLTASGYGNHSRQVLAALIACEKFDISVRPTKWGDTPFIYESTPFLDYVRKLCVKGEEEEANGAQYDVSVQVTIPNEFRKMAKLNIGVTAGIEVDRASPEWIKSVNENVDVVIVPSSHSAKTLAQVSYSSKEGQELKLQKNVMVSPEGVDTKFFNTEQLDDHTDIGDDLPDFNFLVVGLGLNKGMGEDRKNITTTVKWFCEAFKDSRDVGLVMKVSLVGGSLLDFDACKRRIEDIKRSTGCGEFPRIKLVHGRLSDSEMAGLYKHPKVSALLSLTHGEGFGLPILEAAACGLPVIATDWSGHVDFLQIDGKKRFVPLEYDLREIPDGAVWQGVMEKGSRWAFPKEEDVKHKMKKLVLSYDRPKAWAAELAAHVAKNYSLESTAYAFAGGVLRIVGQAIVNTKDPQEFVSSVRKTLEISEGDKTLIFTMPMSAGDVYIATGVIDSLKRKFPDHRIFFATGQAYRSILEDNSDIDTVMRFENWMMNVPLLEQIFGEVYTPNLAIQTLSSNWVHGGNGRLLGDEMAAQCHVEYGEPKIKPIDPEDGIPEGDYVCFNPGSGKGQWEARNYLHWQEVVNNLVATGVKVVQVGMSDDPLYDGVTDLRGKTKDFRQLAAVVAGAKLMLGIDSVTNHLAAGLGTPYVSLFGSSYPTSTGPVNTKKTLNVLLETPTRYTCEKACYKYQCSVDRDHPCINEIEPKKVFGNVHAILQMTTDIDPKKLHDHEYKEHRPKISGYTHILNPDSQGMPYIESIRSMLGFCDEVVVVDGGSDDGSLQKIKEISDERVKVIERKWDWDEPGMDGQQKAFARANCTGDFLWQQDADEVVHEDDYDKIRRLAVRFPKDIDLVSLPVVELWGGPDYVRTDRHSWKWRFSRNDFRITHGINRAARVYDEKTGKTYAKKGMSDGCEYIDIMTGEFIPHKSFYTQDLERLRRTDPESYGKSMNRIFSEMPCVFHYSWANIPRKIRHFARFWDRCWSNLYHDEKPERRFFADMDPESVTDSDVSRVAEEVFLRGGEHGQAVTFPLGRKNPAVMREWISRIPTWEREDASS